MTTKYNVLSEPIRILRRLQTFGYRTAILAGGAIRDDFTHKPINDYDIFLWDPRHSREFSGMDLKSASFEMERTTEFVDILQTLELDQLFHDNGPYGPCTGDGDPLNSPGIGAKLTGVWEAELDYNKYQLIYTKINPIEHLNLYFDIGLCKAYCDSVKIRYTPDFMKDINNRTLTILAEEMTYDQFEYAYDYHIDKLRLKYPTFKVVVAPHNQHLFELYQLKNS